MQAATIHNSKQAGYTFSCHRWAARCRRGGHVRCVATDTAATPTAGTPTAVTSRPRAAAAVLFLVGISYSHSPRQPTTASNHVVSISKQLLAPHWFDLWHPTFRRVGRGLFARVVGAGVGVARATQAHSGQLSLRLQVHDYDAKQAPARKIPHVGRTRTITSDESLAATLAPSRW